MLPDRLATSDGSLIGPSQPDGNVRGNYQDSMEVVVKIKAVAA